MNASEARPDDTRARVVAARAKVALGQCTEALAELLSLRGAPGWGATALVDEARCHHHQGSAAAELTALSEAVVLDPRNGPAWAALVRVADRLGEVALAREARDHLWTIEDGPVLAELAEARWATEGGHPDADVRIRGVGPLAANRAALLDGRRWLDLGWPEAAAAALYEAVRIDLRDPEVAAWRAEALRRVGDLAQAEASLGRPWIAALEPTPLLLAVSARMAVDGGHIDRAGELLAAHPQPWSAEALASRWYLARARGGDVEGLAARWRSAEDHPGRALQQLVPH